MSPEFSLPLFWRVCLTNGAVFILGTLVFVLSPATVSARPLWSEVVVLSIGLGVIVLLNGLLLRSRARPPDSFLSLGVLPAAGHASGESRTGGYALGFVLLASVRLGFLAALVGLHSACAGAP